MEKQHARDLAHEDIKREELEDKLRGEIKELNLVIEELSGQLYDMEEHLAAGGIPYKPTLNENPGASSKTLLSAVIGVKEAAHTFSRTFMSYLKQHLTKARDLDEQICLESEVIVARPSDYKFLVQSFICRRMFLDFESECFNIDTCMTEIFDIEEHSRACFQEYMTYRNVAETVTLPWSTQASASAAASSELKSIWRPHKLAHRPQHPHPLRLPQGDPSLPKGEVYAWLTSACKCPREGCIVTGVDRVASYAGRFRFELMKGLRCGVIACQPVSFLAHSSVSASSSRKFCSRSNFLTQVM